MNTTNEIKIKLTADGSGTPAVFSRAAKDLRGVGDAAGYTRQQMQQVQFQLTDIATGLATGQSPFTVLMQQGGQLKDTFGGVGGAFRAAGAGLAAVISPLNIASAAIAALATGAFKGSQESAELRNTLALTGNAAGITAGDFETMAQRVAQAGDVSIGAARELGTGLVASGRVGSSALETVSIAAARLQAVTGSSSESIITDFAGMSSGVAAWALEHNRAWHFVSSAQLEYIRTLEESGDTQGAMVETGKALIDHLAQQEQQLGSVERGWREMGNAASAAWDAIKVIGRDSTPYDRLRDAENKLAKLRQHARGGGAGLAGQFFLGTEAEAKAEVDTANRDILRQAEGASSRASMAIQNEKDIKRRAELRRVTEALSGANSEYAKSIKTIQDSFAAGDFGEEQRIQLLTEAATKYGTKAGGESASDLAARREREYRKMVADTLANRAPRLADMEAAGYEASNRAAEENMARTAEQLRRRNEQAEAFGLQLADDTAAINASMIAGDRERGLAQIELERQASQGRIDILAAAGADVLAAQDALNANIVARQLALNEQLKAPWERMLDAWSDKTQQMRSTFDEAMTGILHDAEDGFTKLITTGELDFKSLGTNLLSTVARNEFRTNLAPLVSQGARAFLPAIGISSPGQGAGASADSWERDLEDMGFITRKQTALLGDNTQAMSIFRKGLDVMGGAVSNAAQSVFTFISSLASGSGSGGGGWISAIASAASAYFGGGDVGITSGNTGLVDYGLGGGRANGGSVRQGMDYWVGERGPERLRMYRGGGGFVTPSGSGGAPAGPTFVTHNHFAAGVTPAQFEAGLAAQRQQTRAEVLTSAGRPGRELWRLARS